MWVVLLFGAISSVAGNTECFWATGRVECHGRPERVKNTVVEIWDKDGPPQIGVVDALDPDDMAGLNVVDNTDGIFKVEGCASDVDWLGPLHRNRPEFYLKIRHRCKSDEWTEITLTPPVKVYAPLTMDYYMEHPIQLD